MAYKKQTFTNGQTLLADHLNHIEDGIAELEGQLSGSQPSGDFLTESEADQKYQPKGDYLTESEADQKYQPSGSYLTESDANSKYQPIGDYLSQFPALKTINGQSIFGTGNIQIEGSSGSGTSGGSTTNDNVDLTDLQMKMRSVTGVIDTPSFEPGGISVNSGSLTYGQQGNFIRMSQGTFVHLKVGDTFGLTDYSKYWYQVFYEENGVYTYKSYHGVKGDFVASVEGDYTIAIQSADASNIHSKIGEVLSYFFIKSPNSLAEQLEETQAGLDENNERVAAMEDQLERVDSSSLYRITNIIDNSNSAKFETQYGTISHEEDGFHKITPAENQYPKIRYTINDELQAGRKYLVACTMKYDLGTITGTSVTIRLQSGGENQTADLALRNPTGKAYYSANRFAAVFECATTAKYKIVEVLVGYVNASDTTGTWFAIKDLNVIDITDLPEMKPYYLGNMIVNQFNGLVEGTQLINIDSENKYPLANHKILFLGDSIFGNYDIPSYVKHITKAQCVNGAIGGTTAHDQGTESLVNISASIKSGDWSSFDGSTKDAIARLRALDFNTVDNVIIEIGTNDWRRNPDIGENDNVDTTTFKGSLNTIVSNILSAYPNIDIYFLTPLFRTEFDANTTPNEKGDYLYEYADAVIDIAKKYGLPVFDMHRHGGINEFNATKYLSDGTHPNPIMRVKIAKIIKSLLMGN